MEKCDKCGEFIEFARFCPLCVHYEKERLKRSAKKCEERARKAEELNRELVETLETVRQHVRKINNYCYKGLSVSGAMLVKDNIPLETVIDIDGWSKKDKGIDATLTKAKEVLGDGDHQSQDS